MNYLKTYLRMLCTLLAMAMLALSGPAILTGCDNDGPLENAAEEIEDAADEVGDKIEDAVD